MLVSSEAVATDAVVNSDRAVRVAGKPDRPLVRYHGGKWRVAPWIISHFPRHRVYVEPFGGGASVLLRKERVHAEVINDLDDEIVNMYRVLRDPKRAQQLIDALRLTPFARTEFKSTYRSRASSPVERARRLIARSFMGFGSASTHREHVTGFRASSSRSGTTPARDWANYPDALPLLVERLAGVIVEHRDAIHVIQHHDALDTLHYCDPPYVIAARSFKRRATGQVYKHEYTDADHRRLSEALHAARGMVILSGYACRLYDVELYPDWHRVETQARADGAKPRTEVLWMNAAAASRLPQPSLFEL